MNRIIPIIWITLAALALGWLVGAYTDHILAG
jgi:hypothetical protein